jgi:hypothetical protein
VQRTAEEIRQIAPDPEVDEPAPAALETATADEVAAKDLSDQRRPQLVPPAARILEAPPRPAEPDEPLEDAAQRFREIFGIPEPKPRRPWRRRPQSTGW